MVHKAMSLSDCPHCWETPCVCDNGAGYRHLSIEELTRIRNACDRLIAWKQRRGQGVGYREHDGRNPKLIEPETMCERMRRELETPLFADYEFPE